MVELQAQAGATMRAVRGVAGARGQGQQHRPGTKGRGLYIPAPGRTTASTNGHQYSVVKFVKPPKAQFLLSAVDPLHPRTQLRRHRSHPGQRGWWLGAVCQRAEPPPWVVVDCTVTKHLEGTFFTSFF